MSYDTAKPYIASYLLVTNKTDQVAFVLRAHTAWMNGYYGLPSGKVEKDESYVQAAIREAEEEIGIKIKAQDLNHALTIHRFELSSDAKVWVDVYFKVKSWRGEPHNAEPNKHSEFTWFDPKNLPKNVIPSVKFALEQIQAGKSYAEYGWDKNES